MKVNMHQAKSQLSKLGKLAWQGEEIVIAKAGEPYLRLTPYRERLEKRKMGRSGCLRSSTTMMKDSSG